MEVDHPERRANAITPFVSAGSFPLSNVRNLSHAQEVLTKDGIDPSEHPSRGGCVSFQVARSMENSEADMGENVDLADDLLEAISLQRSALRRMPQTPYLSRLLQVHGQGPRSFSVFRHDHDAEPRESFVCNFCHLQCNHAPFHLPLWTHPISGEPVGMGNFCCPSCVAAYDQREFGGTHFDIIHEYIWSVCPELKGVVISESPPPELSMEKYGNGGAMTEEGYKKLVREDLLGVETPLRHVVHINVIPADVILETQFRQRGLVERMLPPPPLDVLTME